MNSTRRKFVKTCAMAGAAMALLPCGAISGSVMDSLTGAYPERRVEPGGAPAELWKWSKESRYFTKYADQLVCGLCPNACRLPEEARSRCLVRVNKGGKLYSLVYGNPAAVHIDPIEKKPLYHFLPGAQAFSMGTAGCNFQCLNCQNWDISQKMPEELQNQSLFPEEAVAAAKKSNCAAIAYTYNEPSVAFEFVLDTARLARAASLRNVYISNGYISPEPLKELCQFLDAANINLKSFSQSIYRKLNYGNLKPVLDTLVTLKEKGVWLEVTNLVVPTWNDDIPMIARMSRWIVKNLGPDQVLHFSRFYPKYRLTHLPPTPEKSLIAARNAAMDAGLRFVYIGNIRTDEGSTTVCPGCKKPVVERIGYQVTTANLKDGKCANCGAAIAGRWN